MIFSIEPIRENLIRSDITRLSQEFIEMDSSSSYHSVYIVLGGEQVLYGEQSLPAIIYDYTSELCQVFSDKDHEFTIDGFPIARLFINGADAVITLTQFVTQKKESIPVRIKDLVGALALCINKLAYGMYVLNVRSEKGLERGAGCTPTNAARSSR